MCNPPVTPNLLRIHLPMHAYMHIHLGAKHEGQGMEGPAQPSPDLQIGGNPARNRCPGADDAAAADRVTHSILRT